jgi:uncharacterized UBP type Zn finger protein
MPKEDKCVYCKKAIGDNRAVSVCDQCGIGVWGERMFRAIIQNMGAARTRGDLDQGSVCESEIMEARQRKAA